MRSAAARGRSLSPHHPPGCEHHGGRGEAYGTISSAVPDPSGAPRPPVGHLGPAAPPWPVGSPGRAGAPASPPAPRPGLSALPERAPGSPWVQRGARVSRSLGFWDR